MLLINLLFEPSYEVKFHVACGSITFHAVPRCGASDLGATFSNLQQQHANFSPPDVRTSSSLRRRRHRLRWGKGTSSNASVVGLIVFCGGLELLLLLCCETPRIKSKGLSTLSLSHRYPVTPLAIHSHLSRCLSISIHASFVIA